MTISLFDNYALTISSLNYFRLTLRNNTHISRAGQVALFLVQLTLEIVILHATKLCH